jgi:RNA polymerase sigma-70 factor (family 1)
MNYLSDLQLLENIKANDSAAYKELFDRFWERLYRFAWKRLKSQQDAEDVVQHVFMKLWEHRANRDVEVSVEQYLYRSVYYEVLAVLKNMVSRPEDLSHVNENILPSFNNIHQNIATIEFDKLVEEAISRLPARMQEIYRLSRESDLSIAEIAEKLDISEQTVKNQLTTALSRLRKPLSEAMLMLLLSELTLT